jgi:hypothetical protein
MHLLHYCCNSEAPFQRLVAVVFWYQESRIDHLIVTTWYMSAKCTQHVEYIAI